MKKYKKKGFDFQEKTKVKGIRVVDNQAGDFLEGRSFKNKKELLEVINSMREDAGEGRFKNINEALEILDLRIKKKGEL